MTEDVAKQFRQKGERGTTTTKLVAAGLRKHLAFIGGTSIASIPTFRDIVITKQGYDEGDGLKQMRKSW